MSFGRLGARGGFGSLGALGKASGGAQPLRMASSYNRVNTALLTAGANGLECVTDSIHQIGSGDCSGLRILFNNIVWNTTIGPAFAGNAVQIKEAYVYIYSATSPVRVTFGGLNGVTMTNGQTDVLSDLIPPSAIGLTGKFSVGQIFRVITRMAVTAGAFLPILEGTDGGTVEGHYYDPTVTSPVFTGLFGPTFTGTAPTSTFGYAPIVVGQFVAGDPYTFGGFGDSIFANGNKSSYFMRSLRTTQTAGIVIGRIGGTSESVNTLGCTMVKYVSGAVEEYHTNYIGLRTLGQLQTLSQTAWATLRANAIASPAGTLFKIGRTALLVHTSGAWTAADFSDQTVISGWGAGELAEQYNQWAATQVGVGGGVDFYTDVSAQVRAGISAPNFYKWNAPGYTVDGLHPNAGVASDNLGAALGVLYPGYVAPTGTVFDLINSSPTVMLMNQRLTAAGSQSGWTSGVGTVGKSSGKYYCEFLVSGTPSTALIGIVNRSAGLTATFPGADLNGIGWVNDNRVLVNGANLGSIVTWAAGNLLSMAVDLGNKTIWFRVGSGNWNNSGTANPATNTGGISLSTLNAGPYFPVVTPNTYGNSFTANFGATAYAQSVPSGFGNWA